MDQIASAIVLGAVLGAFVLGLFFRWGMGRLAEAIDDFSSVYQWKDGGDEVDEEDIAP